MAEHEELTAAVAELRKALTFYDTNNAASESERIAVGQDAWDWVLKAARNAVAKVDNEEG